MTPRQAKLLRFIERHIAEHGQGPSVREMSAGAGFHSIAATYRELTGLESAGRIHRNGRKRGIEIVGLPTLLISLTDEQLIAEVGRRGLRCAT